MKVLMKKSWILFLIISGTLLFSCSDEESGVAQFNVKMEAVSSSSNLASNGRSLNSGFTFHEVFVGVTEIELETLEEKQHDDMNEDTDEDSDELEFEGNFIVDLIAGTSTPDFGLTALPSGVYEELEIEMEPILEDGNTIFVAFEYTPDGATESVQVEFSTSEELEFELESENGFELEETSVNQLLILFDLDALLAGIYLANATADEDGVIRINETSNTEIFDVVANNLEQALEAGEDDDDDGEFDDDEESD